jgi:hypothetical protein
VLIDDLHGPRTPEAIGLHLGCSGLTVRRWIAKDAAPRSAMLALFWETRWGLSALDAQAVNLVRTHVGLNMALRRANAALQRRCEMLEALGGFGSANSPMFVNVEGSSHSHHHDNDHENREISHSFLLMNMTQPNNTTLPKASATVSI